MGEPPGGNCDKLSLAFWKIKLFYVDLYGFLFAGLALREFQRKHSIFEFGFDRLTTGCVTGCRS
jgi:hypothetical protein